MGKQKCLDASGSDTGTSCKLLVQAPRLKNTPDRNGTVTVVSVGFGDIDEDELRLISSGEGDNNTIIAQGTDASAGLAVMHKLLGNLVEKVCLNLPVDCVVEYTDWSECPDKCGQQYQFKKKRIVVESKNGGKSCPSEKQMLIKVYRDCPPLARCTTTPTTTTTTTTTPTAAKSTTSETASTPITSFTDPAFEEPGKGDMQVDFGMVETFTWTVATVYSTVTMLFL